MRLLLPVLVLALLASTRAAEGKPQSCPADCYGDGVMVWISWVNPCFWVTQLVAWHSGEKCHPGAHGEVGDVIMFAFTLLCSLCALTDSCEGRCDEGFNALKKCQCDTLCNYYQSCCTDYSTVCKAKGTSPAAIHVPGHRPRWFRVPNSVLCPWGNGRTGVWH